MKLYIKQHVFSWTDKFTIKDEAGNDRYFAEGEFLSWGKKLHIFDAGEREVIYIRQKLFSWLPKYHIYIGENQVAEVVKELTFLRPRYWVAGLNWDIKGDFWEHEYAVLSSGEPVVRISKKWLTWGDCYMLDILNDENELPALAVVLAIDCITAQRAAANS